MLETIAIVDGKIPPTGTSARMSHAAKGLAGGMAVNTARACKRWGSLAGLITKAGSNLSKVLTDEFKAGVLLAPVAAEKSARASATCVTLVHNIKQARRGNRLDKAETERTFLMYPGKGVGVLCSDLESPQAVEVLSRSSHIHLAGVGDGSETDESQQTCFDEVRLASWLQDWKATGKTISVDFAPVTERLCDSKWRNKINRMLEQADFLFPSDLEAICFATGSPPSTKSRGRLHTEKIEEAAETFNSRFPSALTVIKARSNGCYIKRLADHAGEGWIEAERNIHSVDPTGAGDVFCGAFMTCLLRFQARPAARPDGESPVVSNAILGRDFPAEAAAFIEPALLRIAACYANAAAADSLSKIGGARYLPSWDDIGKHRVRQHPALTAALAEDSSPEFKVAAHLGLLQPKARKAKS